MAFYFYLSTKIIMVFITKSYQDLFGVRSYINAKYKDDVTPAAIHKVDSTRMDLGRRIVERFHRIVGVR